MIHRVYLRSFRNYQGAEYAFKAGINWICGDNGKGKTNLLEALYLISTGQSFRTAHFEELIYQEKEEKDPFFFLEAHFTKEGIEQKVSLSFDGKGKKMEHSGSKYAHFTNLLGLLPIVLIAPEDIKLIAGSPLERRRFLDIHLAQIDPLYVYHVTRYQRALKQRNVLLKSRKIGSIESWEEIMKSAASYLYQKRKALIEELTPYAKEAMKSLSFGKETLTLQYIPSLIDDFRKTREKEMIVGTTLFGPHRDDFTLNINDKEAKTFASQGQNRCAVSALRLSEWHHFKKVNSQAPILAIDDFGVHLDKVRSDLLLDQIKNLSQVFLTTPFPPQDPTAISVAL